MMLSARLSSAVARRAPVSPATPLLLPRLSSTASSSSSSLSSSFSRSTSSPARAYSSRASSPLATTSIRKTPLSTTSSRWSGVSSFNLSQTRTMALNGKKIQVKNPVVELDGDEV